MCYMRRRGPVGLYRHQLFLHPPLSLSLRAVYAFFNMGIRSVGDFSTIQDMDDMIELVDMVGDGGPEGWAMVAEVLRFCKLRAWRL